jgi:hypothetical protein
MVAGAAPMALRPKRTGIPAPDRTLAAPPVADWLEIGNRIWAYNEESLRLFEAEEAARAPAAAAAANSVGMGSTGIAPGGLSGSFVVEVFGS